MNPLPPQILCAGKVLENFVAVRVEIRRSVQWIPEASIVLQRPKGSKTTWWKECSALAAKCMPGEELTIKEGSLEVFKGLIVEQSVVFKDKEFRLLVKHPLQRLVNTLRSQVFQDQDDGQIISGVLKEHGVSATTSQMTTKHPQMIQWDCSDWQFLQSRLAAYPVWLIPTRDKVECRPPALGGKTHVVKAVSDDPKKEVKVEDAQWRFSNDVQSAGVTLQYWDVDQQKLSTAVTGKAKAIGDGALATAIKPLSAKHGLALKQSVWSVNSEAQALADARQLAQVAAGIQVWLRVREYAGEGEITLKYELGDTLELSGFGSGFSGKGVISMLEHTWVRGNWTCVVATGMPLVQAQDGASLPRNTRPIIGVVQPYQKDSRGLNRLPIKIPMLGVEKPLFARMGSPYASKDMGLCLYPEAYDEVIVTFVDDDPRYPLILGALHNPKNKAPFEPSQDNALKGFQYVSDGKKHSWLFDLKKGAFNLINDQNSLAMDATGVVVHGAKKLELTGDQSNLAMDSTGIVIKGPKIDLTQ